MVDMNISLPEDLRSFVEEQAAERGLGSSGEFVSELVRKEQDRQRLRGLLLAGAASEPAIEADAAYFDALRERALTGIPEAQR